MLNPNTIQQSLVDAITERPISFSVGSVCYNIYPPSLGLYLLRSRLLSSLELDSKLLELNPTLELMRLVHEYRDIVLHLIALSTLRGYAEVNDTAKLGGRKKHLGNKLTTKELTQLLSLILLPDRYDEIAEHFGITKEATMRERVAKVKEDKTMMHFGGRTLYGGLIDYACERYGWTLDYCVWGISYENLRLLTADANQSVHLSEEESKKLFSSSANINADDPANYERIAELLGG